MKLFLLLLIPILASSCTTVPTHLSWNTIDDYLQHPLLYKLTNKDRTIYIVGTMHVDKPIPENLRTLIRASEVYISESDTIDTDGEGEGDETVTKGHGVLGERFSLSPEAIAAAEVALEGRTPHEVVIHMTPRELSEQVQRDVKAWAQVDEEMKNQQVQGENENPLARIYDVQLEIAARTAAVKRVALETGDELDLLKCEELSGVRYLEKRAYDQGLQKSASLWENAKAQEDEWCLKRRNHEWMKIIGPLESRYHRLFIAVGIAHVAFGEDNLIDLFTKKGYNIERQ
jgi:hypothetical protein